MAFRNNIFIVYWFTNLRNLLNEIIFLFSLEKILSSKKFSLEKIFSKISFGKIIIRYNTVGCY